MSFPVEKRAEENQQGTMASSTLAIGAMHGQREDIQGEKCCEHKHAPKDDRHTNAQPNGPAEVHCQYYFFPDFWFEFWEVNFGS